MTDICHCCDDTGLATVMCGGKIKEVITQEGDSYVVDRVCSVCGRSSACEKVVLKMPREIAQTVFPGFFPAQVKLF